MSKYISFTYDPNEDTNIRSMTIEESVEYIDSKLLDQYGNKLFKSEKIKMGFLTTSISS